MVITFGFDYDKILKSKIGTFAVVYYSAFIKRHKKLRAKSNSDRIGNFIYHAIGRLSVLYLDFFTYLYFRSLSKEELDKILSGHS
jgi:hypothetical protein